MSKLSNALRMIELLRSRGKMKISELAEELEVRERMVRIYRDELEKAGIFVDSQAGRDGGYSLSRHSLFPTRNLSAQELEALVFAVGQLSNKGSLHSEAATVALDKLKAVRVTEQEADRYIYFVQRSKPNYEFSDEHHKYVQLQEALTRQQKVQIVYEASSGERTERIINPYGLVHYNEFFYCIAFCNAKQGKRMFKLSRMKELQLIDETYRIPHDFDVRSEFPRFGIMKEKIEVELFIFPPFSLSVPETIWGEDQHIEHNEDHSILFRATMSGKESVKKWVLGMGAAVKVIAPVSLRDEVLGEHKKLMKLYGVL